VSGTAKQGGRKKRPELVSKIPHLGVNVAAIELAGVRVEHLVQRGIQRAAAPTHGRAGPRPLLLRSPGLHRT